MVLRSQKKAAKPLDNLCLDIPLPPADPFDWNSHVRPFEGLKPYWDTLYSKTPLTIDPDKPTQITFTTPSWRPAAAQQVKSRLNRKRLSPVAFTNTIDINSRDTLDWSSTAALIEKMRVNIDSHLKDMLLTSFKPRSANPVPYPARGGSLHGMASYMGLDWGLERARPQRAEDLESVTTLIETMRDWGSYERVDMGYRVTDPLREDPRFLNAFIFGPRGEFTGFARVEALNKLCHMACRRESGEMIRGALENFPVRPEFDVMCLTSLDQAARFVPSLRHEGVHAYFRFASYADQAAWESLASYDRTDIYGGF